MSQRWGRRLSQLFLVPLALAVTTWPATLKGQVPASMAELEASFLYEFLPLIHWEREPQQALICLLADPGPEERMRAILLRRAQSGRPVRTRRVPPVATQSTADCDLLYISSAYADHVPNLLARLAQARTVTVSDAPNFIDQGGVIGFVIVAERLRFEVNMRAAEKKVKISARLLELAVRVLRLLFDRGRCARRARLEAEKHPRSQGVQPRSPVGRHERKKLNRSEYGYAAVHHRSKR
jgi:hypothetical protein